MASALHLILVYRYWILFPLACFEGPITGFIIGTLVALGYFNVFAAYFLLVMGDVIPDVAYYFLGRYGERVSFLQKYMQKVGIGDEHIGVIRNLWLKHTGKTMFFSKLAYGLSTPFLISAGFIKLDFKKFVAYALPVTFGQYAVLMALGYFFGASYYNTITKSLNGIGIVIAAAVVIGVAYFFFTRFMRQKLLKVEEVEKAEETKAASTEDISHEQPNPNT